ncbi:hypothetical protein M9H77_12389 [Catharanthus roseus]|uniref:Uncharacterized protein n=1 Tax=Catharanthus roseus TaxID=4058 RepID=A0ACC0BHB0_CATRO|nr:hypothetical protein M9H77_12389 [Catharanthus roseus]
MFIRMYRKNSDFFHLIYMDDEGRPDSVFWLHSRSKLAYEEFNDMVYYYWSQPPWPIHIFWFSTPISRGHRDIYLGQAPTAIMIDQCESMGNAIKEVMPITIRRYCIWHIMCELPDKFKGLMEQFHKAGKKFRSLVYDSLTKSMFENNWKSVCCKYGLETN